MNIFDRITGFSGSFFAESLIRIDLVIKIPIAVSFRAQREILAGSFERNKITLSFQT
jgi:hypothetical protein